MAGYKKVFADTAPFIYYIEGSIGNITRCDLFLTNDKQPKQFTETRCITVEEL